MTRRCAGEPRDLEEHVHADREIRGVNETDTRLLNHLAHARKMFIPSRRSDRHVDAGARAGLDVAEHGAGRGEVDDGIDSADLLGGKRRPALVLRRGDDGDLMASLARYL